MLCLFNYYDLKSVISH